MTKKKTTEQFIKESMKVYGEEYDYSEAEYQSAKVKVWIKHIECGYEFAKTPDKHLRGQGCPECAKSKNRTPRKTIQAFIKDARKVHGESYDYSEVDYQGSGVTVLIKHIECGCQFNQTPGNHLSGQGCPECAKSKNRTPLKTMEQFIQDSIGVHGYIYDYSKVDYQGSHVKVLIKHVDCEYEFIQTPGSHLSGVGCPNCYGSYKKTLQQFISDAREIHGDSYDYSKAEYHNAKTKIRIKHMECGKEFIQTPDTHLRERGCPSCAIIIRGLGNKKNLEEFIRNAKKVHGDEYDYNDFTYENCKTKGVIIHRKCKYRFTQTPSNHLLGQGCAKCKSSKGEMIISKYLDDENIEHEIEKRFPNCKNTRELPFDFYVPKWNVCIEYDGEQHYREVKYWGGAEGFKQRKINDAIKDRFCQDTGILLERIKYDEKIEDRMDELFIIYNS